MLRLTPFLAALCLLLPRAAGPALAETRPYAMPLTEQRDMVSPGGGTYRVMIARPSVEPPPAGYPVVYALDGNAVFGTLVDVLRGAEIRQALMGSVLGGIEPAVVVAIGYPGDAPYDLDRRALDYTPAAPPAPGGATGRPQPQSGGADAFLAFIEDDLKPAIAREFPVDAARQALFGHSYGGLFAMHVLFTRPQAFSTYVASSPSLWWNAGSIRHEEEAFAAGAAGRSYDVRVILSVGQYEQRLSPRERAALPPDKADERTRRLRQRAMVDSTAALADRLGVLPGLAVRFRIHEGETHGSVVPIALARAMPLLWED